MMQVHFREIYYLAVLAHSVFNFILYNHPRFKKKIVSYCIWWKNVENAFMHLMFYYRNKITEPLFVKTTLQSFVSLDN